MNEQLEFVKLIAYRLESNGIAYMLTGSMALAIYAVPRMTRDIDLVIACRPEDVEKLVKLFEADCYVDADSIRDAIVGRAMFNIIHKEWIIKADFIIRKDHRYRQVEFDRRRRFDIEGTPIYVVAPEDLLLSKLHWSKDSGSELQLRDARSVMESVDDLDWSYLETWAKDLGVWGILERVRNE